MKDVSSMIEITFADGSVGYIVILENGNIETDLNAIHSVLEHKEEKDGEWSSCEFVDRETLPPRNAKK